MYVIPNKDGKITQDTTGSRSIPYKKGVGINLPDQQAQFMVDCGAATDPLVEKKIPAAFDAASVELTEDGLKNLKLDQLKAVCKHLEFPEDGYININSKKGVVEYILSDKEDIVFDASKVEITEEGLLDLSLDQLQHVCVYLEFLDGDYATIKDEVDLIEYILSDKTED
jgi:hypothetical protein